MNDHCRYKFSVTIHTDFLGLVSCMRGLAQHCQVDGIKAISWGGTKESDWLAANHQVTFRFSNPGYRADFLREAGRLFSVLFWKFVRVNDNDPARPQA